MDDSDNTVIEEYMEELKRDTSIDEMNIKDRAMRLPAIKHKWVGRLIRHKIELDKLFRKRKAMIGVVADAIQKESAVMLMRVNAEKSAAQHEKIREIDLLIKDNKVYVEFLEKVEKILSSMTFDIKNAVQIMQLETT